MSLSAASEVIRLKEESKTAEMLIRCKNNAKTIMEKKSEIISRLKAAKNEFSNGNETQKANAEEKRQKAMEEYKVQEERLNRLMKLCKNYSSAFAPSTSQSKSTATKTTKTSGGKRKRKTKKGKKRKTKYRGRTRRRY
jgi:hypothetical protein